MHQPMLRVCLGQSRAIDTIQRAPHTSKRLDGRHEDNERARNEDHFTLGFPLFLRTTTTTTTTTKKSPPNERRDAMPHTQSRGAAFLYLIPHPLGGALTRHFGSWRANSRHRRSSGTRTSTAQAADPGATACQNFCTARWRERGGNRRTHSEKTANNFRDQANRI